MNLIQKAYVQTRLLCNTWIAAGGMGCPSVLRLLSHQTELRPTPQPPQVFAAVVWHVE